MAAGRKIRDEKEARQYLMAAERSGVRVTEWARGHGVDGRSLRAWVINLGRRAVRPQKRVARRLAQVRRSAKALVELVPARPGPGPGVEAAGAARYIVDVAQGRIEFGDDASMATLRQVIEALRSC